MVTYDSLSVEEQAQLQAWVNQFRSFATNFIGKGVVTGRALDAARSASGGAQDLIDSLDALEVVPNTSGLAGAQGLTKEELGALITGLSAFLASYDTTNVRENVAKAGGPTAGL
jgi:hypothetical protein